VLFFDEIDAVLGESLISVLPQLRAGFSERDAGGFPWSVELCGLRDVRDYKAMSGGDSTLVRWPYTPPGGSRRVQREALEIKTWRAGKADPLRQGLRQLDGYLDRFQLDTGTLALFDQRPDAPAIDERTEITAATSPVGRAITVLRG